MSPFIYALPKFANTYLHFHLKKLHEILYWHIREVHSEHTINYQIQFYNYFLELLNSPDPILTIQFETIVGTEMSRLD